MIDSALTDKVISAIFEVSNTLGCGFREKLYHRALLIELKRCGLQARAEAPFPVFYKGKRVGDYYADILVENTLILELKSVERLCMEHKAQCLNYLRASGKTLCLLINFQHPRVEWKRIILTPPEPALTPQAEGSEQS